MLPAHKATLEAIFSDAALGVARAVQGAGDATFVHPAITFERPKIAAHGDLASNLALQLAKPLRLNPRQLAQQLADAVRADPRAAGLVDTVDIAGPGFINVRLAQAAKQATVAAVLAERETYGLSEYAAGRKVLIEFVSANPTGPLHVGHGRQAALGDALANLLASQGWAVWREYYYNDAGVQIRNLAHSVQARARGFAPGDPGWPENGYNGKYIADIAQDYMAGATVGAADVAPVAGARDVEDLDAIQHFAVAYLRHEQDIDLDAFGVKFNRYFLESSLYEDGRVAEVVDRLTTVGKTYDEDGALWLRTTDDGDDKDRVMRKSDGTYTYFVPDIAYHLTKWERGFTTVINIQGSDHHGTIARVRAGLQGLGMGIPAAYPDYVLHKMVTVMRHGAEVKISKRAGSYVTLRDLIEWSGGGTADSDAAQAGAAANDSAARLQRGRDAVRFFLISRKADTEFVFDVDLALKQNDENPVYYVQYAHARICSVLTQWGGDPSTLPGADLTPLDSERAMALLARLADYPDMLARAAEEFAPHAVAFYLRDLAGDFHSFYNSERVLVDDSRVRDARLALLAATRQVLANGLATIGVSAPEKM